ncbi:hypothetical protein [Halorientalis sp.]|jgi:hypothetical protein|nr:hypothetical protein [Halorientalis sp.]
MFRRLAPVRAAIAVVVGVLVVVQPAGTTGQQTAENGTAFEGPFASR